MLKHKQALTEGVLRDKNIIQPSYPFPYPFVLPLSLETEW